MRVLSPRIDPPVRVLDGSTASTATRCPASTRCMPSASMNVDLPAPGAPVMPTRIARAGRGQERVEQRDRVGAMVGPRRLDERDRLRERAPVAGAHRVGERVRSVSVTRHRCAALAHAARGSPTAAARDVAARAEDRAHAGVLQELVVARPGSRRRRRRRCRRAPCVAQLLDELRHERLVPGRLARARRRRARRSRSRRAPLPRASGTAGRCRRRSRDRRTRSRSPWRRGRGRPGRASRRGCAAGGPRLRRTRRPPCGCAANSSSSAYAPPYTPEIERIIGAVAAEHLLHRVGDLADRRPRACGLDRTARAGCRRRPRPR